MTREDYNEILDDRFQKVLKPLGFRRNGIHYFLHEPPVILQVQNGWKNSETLLFALTLDYLSNTQNADGGVAVSRFPWDFPLSIPPHILRQQYHSHKTIQKFKYDFNFFTREMATTRHFTPLDFGLFFQGFKKTQRLSEAFIDESMDVLLHEGLKLKSEFNSEVAYLALSRFREETYLFEPVFKMKQEIEHQIQSEGRTPPEWQFNFFEKMMLNHHYKQMGKWKPV